MPECARPLRRLERAVGLQHQKAAVIKPPHREVPACAVPEAGQKEHCELIEPRAEPALAVPAERDIHIFAEPGGKRDVPSAPKVLHGFRNVRIIEVFLERKAEGLPEADGHVRIAGKIKVNLKKICDSAEPCRGGGHRPHGKRVNRIRRHGERVGDKHLLGKAEAEAAEARRRLFYCDDARVKLLVHIVIFYDGPGDELGKQRDVKQHVKIVFGKPRVPAIYVEHVAHGLKREERDADGQRDAGEREGKPERPVYAFNKKIRILEKDERAKAPDYGCAAPETSLRGEAFHEKGCGIVYERGENHQQHVNRFAPCIKQQRGNKKERVAPTDAAPKQQIYEKRRRQEQKKERRGAENHVSLRLQSIAGGIDVDRAHCIAQGFKLNALGLNVLRVV